VLRTPTSLRESNARKGKRFRPGVAAFEFDRERQLWTLHEELAAKTYRQCCRLFDTITFQRATTA
jgi:hypothetical protein